MTELALEAQGWNDWFASQTGRCLGHDGSARVLTKIDLVAPAP